MDDEVWMHHLRVLSQGARDSNDTNNDSSLALSVNKLYEICKVEGSADLVARIYPHVNKIFQRCISSSSRPSTALLLLAILQFFLDFGDQALHDADPSLRAFFKCCLSRQFMEPSVAKSTVDFLIKNRAKLSNSFPNLLPQYFPLLLKLIAWNGEMLWKDFLKILPGIVSYGSILPLFSSIIDLPALVLAIERDEGRSGFLKGNSVVPVQKSQAPENLLQLMDEAYTGSTIEDQGSDSGDENLVSGDDADALFLDLLKDENDGLAVRHWTSPGIVAALQFSLGSTPSDRLKQILNIAPIVLEEYFTIVFTIANDSLICALIPILMARNDALFPDRKFSYEIRKRFLKFILSAFESSPHFIAVLKKPIMDRIGEAYDSPAKSELALQLCWAIGEYGAGGISYKDEARELFESLELLLYENLSSSSCLALNYDNSGSHEGAVHKKLGQSRFLCFVVTAIAKIATCHREFVPRARVCLAKVARSKHVFDKTVSMRARDYLGLMTEPAICQSVLGHSCALKHGPVIVDWSEGNTKAVAHIPFYILGDKQGPPFHDFSLSDVLGKI